jgi:hypothetical protein
MPAGSFANANYLGVAVMVGWRRAAVPAIIRYQTRHMLYACRSLARFSVVHNSGPTDIINPIRIGLIEVSK